MNEREYDRTPRQPKIGDIANLGDKSDETYTGKIKKWFSEKGFGFVTHEHKDYFVHITNVEGSTELCQDDMVEFKTIKTMKGIQAVDVVKLEN